MQYPVAINDVQILLFRFDFRPVSRRILPYHNIVYTIIIYGQDKFYTGLMQYDNI